MEKRHGECILLVYRSLQTYTGAKTVVGILNVYIFTVEIVPVELRLVSGSNFGNVWRSLSFFCYSRYMNLTWLCLALSRYIDVGFVGLLIIRRCMSSIAVCVPLVTNATV